MIELALASLRASGRLRVRVAGSSMLPAIRPGDVISVRAGDPHDARPGEVVLFTREGRLFAHRVVRRSSGALVTRGDALADCDRPVQRDEFVGIVESVARGGRSFPARVRVSPLGRAASAVFRRSALAGRLFTRMNAWASRGSR